MWDMFLEDDLYEVMETMVADFVREGVLSDSSTLAMYSINGAVGREVDVVGRLVIERVEHALELQREKVAETVGEMVMEMFAGLEPNELSADSESEYELSDQELEIVRGVVRKAVGQYRASLDV